MYCAVLLATNAIYYYRQGRERELRASQLQTLLSQAQLQLLKSQLQPHFIFNTLHAISTLMARDVVGARLMIVRLSELLRMALERFEAQELSLKEELEFITNYLEIERIRFEDRLTVHINVSPDVLDAMVPALLLQPLVENAVRHGISVQSKPGSISIYGKQNADELEIIISDNGPGPGPNFNAREGVGIANTRARLQKLYGQEFAFDLSAREGSGLEVLIKIPMHFDPLTRASGPVELHQIA
jgi:LytS/YehU family sensor histidine kinase